MVAENYPSTPDIITRQAGDLGEATHTYFVNDTFSNMANGPAIEIISEASADTAFPSPAEAVILNDTFYNDAQGVHTYSPTYDGTNSLSETSIMVMDSIFSTIVGNTTAGLPGYAIELDGQSYGSEVQYNLFYSISGPSTTGPTAPYLYQVNNITNTVTNDQPVLGNPEFRDAATGNFNLLPNSAAIDLARSELGPSFFGDMLYPAVTIDPNNLSAIPVRNEPGVSTVAGDVNPFGGLGGFGFGFGLGNGVNGAPYSADIVTLPGEPVTQRGFPDEWVPVLVTSGLGGGGTASSLATYDYEPVVGERDQEGNLRIKDPNSPNVGFGSRPFFDLGAFEYIIQNPPVVDAVDATSTSGTTNIYSVGGIGGINSLPTSIQIKFNEQLNPSTITGMSVILQASGGDGIFGNGNSPSDRTINLTGDLSFNSTTDILTINTSGIFTSTATANDEYRIILEGTGSSVIRNTDGLALDGLNLDSSGNQLALPSGADQFPGSNFQVTFDIDTHTPSIVSGTFKLDPASDTSGGLKITKNNLPTFDGTISDIFPPANPLLGQTVIVDISSKGNGVFDILDAGQGTTTANGSFQVTLTKPIPDTPNTIGTNGIQGSTGATYAEARVRVINSAGNASNLSTDPLSEYVAEGAVTTLEVDTKPPTVKSFSPAGGAVASVNSSGQVIVSVTFSENIKTTSFNASSVLVERTGGTGSFTAPVFVPIAANSTTISYSTAAATLGQETITFALTSPLVNDEYRVVLKGTGTTPVTDIAGNALDGAGDRVGQRLQQHAVRGLRLRQVAPDLRGERGQPGDRRHRHAGHPREPVHDHRGRHDGRVHRRRRPGPARFLLRGCDAQAGRPTALGRHNQHRHRVPGRQRLSDLHLWCARGDHDNLRRQQHHHGEHHRVGLRHPHRGQRLLDHQPADRRHQLRHHRPDRHRGPGPQLQRHDRPEHRHRRRGRHQRRDLRVRRADLPGL